MTRAIKTKTKRGIACNLFAELSEGMEALSDSRQGKPDAANSRDGIQASPRDHSPGTYSRAKELKNLACALRDLSADECAHLRELGTGPRETKCTGRAAD